MNYKMINLTSKIIKKLTSTYLILYFLHLIIFFYYYYVLQIKTNKMVTQINSIIDNVTKAVIPQALVDFMRVTYISNSFLVLNNWSFVHFLSGFFYYKYFNKDLKKWFLINIAFEIIEFILAYSGHPLYVETYLDIFWDIIITMLGFMVARWLMKGKD